MSLLPPKDAYPRFLGAIWIMEDHLQMNIHVYRETWVEKFALVAGYNLFWLGIVYFVCKCYSKANL